MVVTAGVCYKMGKSPIRLSRIGIFNAVASIEQLANTAGVDDQLLAFVASHMASWVGGNDPSAVGQATHHCNFYIREYRSHWTETEKLDQITKVISILVAKGSPIATAALAISAPQSNN
jgi:hypothetical protein